MKDRDGDFGDRLSTQAKAKQALLEKLRAAAKTNAETFAERDAERRRVAEARATRAAERQAIKDAETARIAAEKVAEAARLAEEARIAEEERQKKLLEEADAMVALLAEQKALRDARYAARKARTGKK